jgi:hypothetical protein
MRNIAEWLAAAAGPNNRPPLLIRLITLDACVSGKRQSAAPSQMSPITCFLV